MLHINDACFVSLWKEVDAKNFLEVTIMNNSLQFVLNK